MSEIYQGVVRFGFPALYNACREYYNKYLDNPDTSFDHLYVRHLFNDSNVHRLINSSYTPSNVEKVRALEQLVMEKLPPIASFIHLFIKHLAPPTTVATVDSSPSIPSTDETSMESDVSSNDQPTPNVKRQGLGYKPQASKSSSSRVSSKGSLKSSPAVPKLDKFQNTGILSVLKSVEHKYPHFTSCKGCEKCESTFRTLYLTYCSKKHGGAACNAYGLYPHAGEKYLTMVHTSDARPVLKSGVCFQNPLAEPCTTPSGPRSTGRKMSSKHSTSSTESCRQTAGVVRNNQVPLNYDETFPSKQISKAIAASHWRLKPETPLSVYADALKRFRQMKKFIPGYSVPSWGTCASKVLFATEDVESARATADRIYHNRRVKRLNYKRKRLS